MGIGSAQHLLILDDFGGCDGDGRAAVHVDAEGGVFGDVAPCARYVGVAADDEAVLPVTKPLLSAVWVRCIEFVRSRGAHTAKVGRNLFLKK